MKARILTSVLVVLVSFGSLCAGNPSSNHKVYTNHEISDSAIVKEYTFVDSETLQPETKSVYNYTTDGILTERVIYAWKTEEGWVAIQKYDYGYNMNGKLLSLIYTKWDKELNAWSTKSQCSYYNYGIHGEILSVKQIEVDSNKANLIAQR